MNDARFVVDASSLVARSRGPATGGIWLMVGSTAFPVAGWNDFVVVVLEAWISALLQLARETSVTERVHFMEGPYAVDLIRLPSGLIRLRALETPSRQHAMADIDARHLLENAVAMADDVLATCGTRAYRTKDVDRLQAVSTALRAEILRLAN